MYTTGIRLLKSSMTFQPLTCVGSTGAHWFFLFLMGIGIGLLFSLVVDSCWPTYSHYIKAHSLRVSERQLSCTYIAAAHPKIREKKKKKEKEKRNGCYSEREMKRPAAIGFQQKKIVFLSFIFSFEK
jgi:hypothetical protein